MKFGSGRRVSVDLSKINNFGKYFIIKQEFEAIPEEDETLEAGSISYDRKEQNSPKRTMSESIRVT